MNIILSWKLGDHKGLAPFIYGQLLKRTLFVVLPAILIQIPIHAFLSPVPVCWRGQPRKSWCCLADAGGMPVPGIRLQETQYLFCIICIIWLIINIISIISAISKTFYIQLVSLSPFSSLSLPLVGGWGLIESICHSVYWRPDLNLWQWAYIVLMQWNWLKNCGGKWNFPLLLQMANENIIFPDLLWV